MLDIIYGINPVLEAIKAKQVKKIFTSLKNEHEIIQLAQQQDIPIISIDQFDQNVIPKSNNQRVIAIIKPYPIYDMKDLETDNPKNILFLDKITDPHNLGAVIRSAAAFGFKHIIIPKDHSAKINEIVHKTSVGATFHVKVYYLNALQNVIKKLKKDEYWFVGFDMKSQQTVNQIFENDLKYVLVLGSEGKGIRESILNEMDFMAKIPMLSTIDSLNVSVSASIAMYEFFKKNT